MSEHKKIHALLPLDSYLKVRALADAKYGGSLNAATVEVVSRGLESIHKSSWLEEAVSRTVSATLENELAEIRRLFAQDVIDAAEDVRADIYAAHSTIRGLLASDCARRSDPDFAYARLDVTGSLISAGMACEDAMSKANELLTSYDPLEAELWRGE